MTIIIIEEKQRRAEAGSRVDQEQLGVAYFRGQEVAVDYVKAAYWFSLAAEQGGAKAMGLLACMYVEGWGVRPDMAEALRLYEKAALLGAFSAQISLARIHRYGAGSPPDPSAAFRWYMAAFVQERDQPVRNAASVEEAKEYVVNAPERLFELEAILDGNLDITLRMSAAIVVGRYQIAGVIPALIRALDDPDERLRAYAAGALGLFDVWIGQADPYHEEVTRALLAAMDDPSKTVRAWATSSVIESAHNTWETQARLWRSLDDPDDEVRATAAYGLAVFETPNFADRLGELLRESSALSPGYFAAAEVVGDASLLPALQLARTRLIAASEDGETLDPEVDSAIAALETTSRLDHAE